MLLLTPIFGAGLFTILYFIATLLYPGGSIVDENSIGFSWTNNYWCNLLNQQAINGENNPARSIALAAMFILCLTLSLFWIIIPKYILTNKKLMLTIQICGILAMTTAFLLLTNINHDLAINIACSFGVIATAGTLIGLYNTKWYGLFAFGLLNILLVGLNNYVYRTGGLIVYLPVVQKITFILFLAWICTINIKAYRKQNKRKH